MIDGEVRAGHVVVNGVINGPVFSTDLIELQSKARISGDVHYKALEMMNGALVSGKLAHDQVAEPVLKLAASTKFGNPVYNNVLKRTLQESVMNAVTEMPSPIIFTEVLQRKLRN